MDAVKRTIDVVGAVIVRDGLVLCVQRGPGGSLPNMWEFPGGKIEAGETAQHALEREINEELRCRVQVDEKITTTRFEYDFAVIELTTFYCDLISGEPYLVEHSDLTWCRPGALHELDWAPADIPAVNLIRSRLVESRPKD